MKKALLILLSATLLAQAFIVPSYLWWTIFIFLMPLFWIAVHTKIRLHDAVLWSSLFVLQAYFAIFIVIAQHGCISYRVFALLFLYLYITFYSSLWLTLYVFITRFITSKAIRLVSLLIAAQLFFFITPYVFCIFGLHVRNYFLNPLVCLAAYPSLLYSATVFPGWVLLCVVLLINFLIFFTLYYDWRLFMCVLVLGIPFSLGFFKENKNVGDYSQVGFPILPPYNDQSARQRAQQIINVLLDYREEYPSKSIIVLPESAYPFELNTPEHRFFLEMLEYSAGQMIVLMGAHRKNTDSLSNCFYYIYEGRIIYTYDKTKLVPIFECTTTIWSNKYCKALFLNKKKEFTPLKRGGEPFFLLENMKLHPRICSEFFFEDSWPANTSLVVVVNDNWFSCIYFPKLLELLAIYRAISNQITIFYCSYTVRRIINKYGLSPNRIHLENAL